MTFTKEFGALIAADLMSLTNKTYILLAFIIRLFLNFAFFPYLSRKTAYKKVHLVVDFTGPVVHQKIL